MRSIVLISVVALCAGLLACSREEPAPSEPDAPVPVPATPTGSVTGVVSGDAGTRVGHATVRVGDMSVTANEQGFFTLSEVEVGRAVLEIRADGFAGSAQAVDVQEGMSTHVLVHMLPVDATRTIDAAAGGRVAAGGSSVEFPAGALDSSGPVTVELAVLDATNEDDLRSFPGDFTTSDGEMLETFGAISVEVIDKAGNDVGLAEGMSANVAIRVPAGSDDTIPLWSFDEASAQWNREGSLTGCADGICEGVVPHLSWWNADQVLETTCLSVCLEDTVGQPAQAVRVVAQGVDYRGSSSGITGPDGCACLNVKKGAEVSVYGVTSGGIFGPQKTSTAADVAACGSGPCPNKLEPPLVVATPKFQATLTWGETPQDLDSHLTGPCDPADSSCSNFFDVGLGGGNLSQPPWASSDTDDTTSYGPEVTTVSKLLGGCYRYQVFNYTGSPSITQSQGVVKARIAGGSDIPEIKVRTACEGKRTWVVGELRCAGPEGQPSADCRWYTLDEFAPSVQEGAACDPIPPLDPQGSPDLTEGPTDYTFYARPTCTIKAVMVFVDFSDAQGGVLTAPGGTETTPAGKPTTETAGDHLLGNDGVMELGDFDTGLQKFLSEQSYGKLNVEVTRLEGWKRMPSPVGDYTGADNHFDTFEEHQTYIQDAAALFPDVDFSDYDLVFVVAAPTPKISLSPTFTARPGWGAQWTSGTGADAKSGEIRLAVTLGNDSYTNRFINLVHEMGHTFGLPDLYPFSNADAKVGPWDLMDNIFQGTSFLGWHRHKMGWLDADRKEYLKSGEWSGTLSPLSVDTDGTSMIVVPVGDSVEKPSKVFVVELAEPVLAKDDSDTLTGEGVLIYSVDATIATGNFPVVVYSKDAADLWKAPWQDGDTFDNADAPMTVDVEKVGSDYKVTVKRR